MKRTAQQRYMAVIDLYRRLTGDRPWTVDEVTQFAEQNALVPVPTLRSPLAVQQAWDAHFLNVVADVELRAKSGEQRAESI
jgi:hypothetical protein